MVGEPTSKAQKLTKSIEMMLKTVLAGAGYASKQLEVLLGRRLLDRGLQGLASARSPEAEQVHQSAATVTLPGEFNRDSRTSNSKPPGPLILVVESQPTLRAILRLVLEKEGYQVAEAEDGTSALRLMTRGLPRLVLQNLVLPDMDGCGLVQWLRTLPGGRAVPDLAISDNAILLDQARSRNIGFEGFLCRPFLPSHLLQTVYGSLPSQRLKDGLPPHLWRAQASEGVRPTTSPVRQSSKGGRVLVIEPNDFQCKKLVEHLVKLGFEAAAVGEGGTALDRARTWRPNVIISDPLIPNIDGFGFCLDMKRDAELRTIPVILTPLGFATDVDVELAHAVGAAGFVSRTPDFAALVSLLRTTLRKKVIDLPVSNPKILPGVAS